MRLKDWTHTARSWDDDRVKAWERRWEKTRRQSGDAAYAAVAHLLSTSSKQPVREGLLRFATSSKRCRMYRAVAIPKKRGGVRQLHVPDPQLKWLQRSLTLVLTHLFDNRVHQCARGFRRGESIVSHAQLHEGKRWVYNVDLEDFFPSVTWPRVYRMLQAKPFGASEDVARILANLATHERALPQGAPSSPMLSNLVAFRLDHRLYRWARSRGLTYSRYADDLTFSSNRRDFSDEDRAAIQRIVEEEGFRLNAQKTRLQAYYERQEVTGLVVNEKANVPREYVRNLRALLHNVKKHGWRSQVDRASLPAEEVERYRRRDLKLAEFRSLDQQQALRHLLIAPEAQLNSIRSWEDMERLLVGRIAFIAQVRGDEDPVVQALFRRLREAREAQAATTAPVDSSTVLRRPTGRRRGKSSTSRVSKLQNALPLTEEITGDPEVQRLAEEMELALLERDPQIEQDKERYGQFKEEVETIKEREALADFLAELGGDTLEFAWLSRNVRRGGRSLNAFKRDALRAAYAVFITKPKRTADFYFTFGAKGGFDGLLHEDSQKSTVELLKEAAAGLIAYRHIIPNTIKDLNREGEGVDMTHPWAFVSACWSMVSRDSEWHPCGNPLFRSGRVIPFRKRIRIDFDGEAFDLIDEFHKLVNKEREVRGGSGKVRFPEVVIPDIGTMFFTDTESVSKGLGAIVRSMITNTKGNIIKIEWLDPESNEGWWILPIRITDPCGRIDVISYDRVSFLFNNKLQTAVEWLRGVADWTMTAPFSDGESISFNVMNLEEYKSTEINQGIIHEIRFYKRI